MAAGFFLFSAAAMILLPADQAGALQPLIALAPALVALGLAVLSLEIGKIRHAGWIFSNLKTSWMSREALCAVVFIVFGAASAVAEPSVGLLIAAAAAAVGFVLCQAMLVRRCVAVSSWRLPATGLFFLTSAAATGFALFQLICHGAGVTAPAVLVAIGAAGVASNAAVWMHILSTARLGDVPKIGTAASLTATLGFGHLVPALFLAAPLFLPLYDTARALLETSSFAACLCIIASIGWQKRTLIVRMAFTDAVAAQWSVRSLTHRLSRAPGDTRMRDHHEPQIETAQG